MRISPVGFFALFTFALIVCLSAWPQINTYPELRKTTLIVVLVCAGGLLAFIVLASEKLEKSSPRRFSFKKRGPVCTFNKPEGIGRSAV